MSVSSAACAANWTGCYVGVHAGAQWSQSDNWTVRTPGAPHTGESLGSHDVDGGLGGVQAGCDYALPNRIVIGVAASLAGTNSQGSHDSARESGVAYYSKVTSLTTFAIRAGYASDRWFGYVHGGGAWERNEYWANQTVLGTAYKASATLPGWTVGVGGEYAITPTLSGFVEYAYCDFGTRNISFAPQTGGLAPALVDMAQRSNLIRIGISLRFGG